MAVIFYVNLYIFNKFESLIYRRINKKRVIENREEKNKKKTEIDRNVGREKQEKNDKKRVKKANRKVFREQERKKF